MKIDVLRSFIISSLLREIVSQATETLESPQPKVDKSDNVDRSLVTALWLAVMGFSWIGSMCILCHNYLKPRSEEVPLTSISVISEPTRMCNSWYQLVTIPKGPNLNNLETTPDGPV